MIPAKNDPAKRPKGLFVTLFVNWVVKPFSMAAIAWLFFRHVFAAWITPMEADQYIAGAIILAAAPCTAMVFVWSHLTNGDPSSDPRGSTVRITPTSFGQTEDTAGREARRCQKQ